ncbi:MAG: hypothetical protein LBE76_06090, partial [Nitrososphaerota archaeon]|nr:hypothetical protein [Nitrososphaerota archaeon]
MTYLKSHKTICEIVVELICVEEVEMDEMWSYVHDKKHQYWLWHAIDHRTGEVLAYTFGTREYCVLEELLLL